MLSCFFLVLLLLLLAAALKPFFLLTAREEALRVVEEPTTRLHNPSGQCKSLILIHCSSFIHFSLCFWSVIAICNVLFSMVGIGSSISSSTFLVSSLRLRGCIFLAFGRSWLFSKGRFDGEDEIFSASAVDSGGVPDPGQRASTIQAASDQLRLGFQRRRRWQDMGGGLPS